MTADLLHDLDGELAARADPHRRAWWERYLKGAVPFRGVDMAGIRAVVDALWHRHRLDDRSTADLLDLALSCFARPHCEDKLAGVLLLAEHALGRLGVEHVPTLAEPFTAGHVEDWNTCDWYSVKVLGPLIAAGPDRRATAEAVASWRSARSPWQRRAAAVAFVGLAPGGDDTVPGLTDLILTVCEANVADPTRWSQTSVGWLLRELSRADPDRVQAWLDRHPELSPEARRQAGKHLGR